MNKPFIISFISAFILMWIVLDITFKQQNYKKVEKTKIDGTYVKTNYIIDLIKDTDSVYIKANDTIYKVPFNQIEKTIDLDSN